MARPYVSVLESLRQRALKEGIDCNRFFNRFNEFLKEIRTSDPGFNDDRQRFIAEHDLSKYYWPKDIFVGQSPERNYHRHLARLQRRALDEGVSYAVFEDVYSRQSLLFESYDGDTDMKAYLTDKGVFEEFWGQTGEQFAGINPRPQPAPTVAPTRGPTRTGTRDNPASLEDSDDDTLAGKPISDRRWIRPAAPTTTSSSKAAKSLPTQVGGTPEMFTPQRRCQRPDACAASIAQPTKPDWPSGGTSQRQDRSGAQTVEELIASGRDAAPSASIYIDRRARCEDAEEETDKAPTPKRRRR